MSFTIVVIKHNNNNNLETNLDFAGEPRDEEDWIDVANRRNLPSDGTILQRHQPQPVQARRAHACSYADDHGKLLGFKAPRRTRAAQNQAAHPAHLAGWIPKLPAVLHASRRKGTIGAKGKIPRTD